MIILFLIMAYLFQGLIASIINAQNCTRIPNGFVDFLKLTFLPYVLFNLKKIKIKL